MRQSNPPHFQQPQLHSRLPSQRRVTVGQVIERGNIQVNSQGQLQQIPQGTHMTTYTTHAQPAPHTLQPPMPDFSQMQPSFSQMQPSFSQAQFLSQPLYQPSGQTPSPFPWEEHDDAVNSIVSSFFRVPATTDQQVPQHPQVHMGPYPGMPNQYQHHL